MICYRSPTQVLPSCPSCSPADGQRQWISPCTSSQPYWQWASAQVLESTCPNTNNTNYQICILVLKLVLLPQLFSVFPLSVCIHTGTHWHRIRRPLRCIRWDSSICNSHRCSCSDAHMDEVSGRTHSGLRIRMILTFCIHSIEQIKIFFLEKWIHL